MAESVPPQDVDRVAAARRAVERRRARASIKRDLAMRVVSGQEVLRRAAEDPTSAAGTLRVPDFLTALPAIGAGKRDRILEALQISPVKRLGGLGVRQRAVLREWLDERFPQSEPRAGRSRLLVLAGPTAVGKGTVATHIRKTHPEIHLSVSATTRAPRPGEIDGVHYYFVDEDRFDQMIADDELLEYATVHN
ncbi:integration host factor, actinobacterial type, partial [Microbacterium keratanolyticum]